MLFLEKLVNKLVQTKEQYSFDKSAIISCWKRFKVDANAGLTLSWFEQPGLETQFPENFRLCEVNIFGGNLQSFVLLLFLHQGRGEIIGPIFPTGNLKFT